MSMYEDWRARAKMIVSSLCAHLKIKAKIILNCTNSQDLDF